MKRNIKLVFGVCAMGLIAIGACKKSSNSSPSTPVSGKWKLVQDGFDLNSNDTLDANEITADSSSTYYTFNNNGSGSVTGMLGTTSITSPFTWTLLYTNTWLKEVIGTDTTYYHVDALTATSMTLRDTTGGFVNWTIYTKQ
jgi:hypothetical protein